MVMHDKELLYVVIVNIISQETRNDIDVFLEPLGDELKVTWDEGVRTYDSHRISFINLKAILMWVIHVFPTYGNMVGCMTKGFHTCPICGRSIGLEYLKCSRKCV